MYSRKAIPTTYTTNETKLECVQAIILRLITSDGKTTPVAALQLYTGNKPIMDDIKQQAELM